MRSKYRIVKYYFSTDTQAELELVKRAAIESGATNAAICNHWAEGGAGATELADAVIAATNKVSNFKVLYDLNIGIEEKINIIAKEMYGAGEVVLADKVSSQFCRKFLFDIKFTQLCVQSIIMNTGSGENKKV